MRNLFILLLFFTTSAFAQGSFKLFVKGLTGSGLIHPRDIYVYLPDGYLDSGVEYKVLYMHDGQNLFDPARGFLGQTWKAERTLNDLIDREVIEPIIVVGIDNTPDRGSEYTPEKNGDAYLRFISRNLKPLIEQQFRVKRGRANTAIMGSSLGGLISLYAGSKYYKQFGLVGAMSPSIWYNQRSILSTLQNSVQMPLKIYLDSGTEGGEKPQDVTDLSFILESRGYLKDETYLTVIQRGADHREAYWAQRLPLALQFLFGI